MTKYLTNRSDEQIKLPGVGILHYFPPVLNLTCELVFESEIENYAYVLFGRENKTPTTPDYPTFQAICDHRVLDELFKLAK